MNKYFIFVFLNSLPFFAKSATEAECWADYERVFVAVNDSSVYTPRNTLADADKILVSCLRSAATQEERDKKHKNKRLIQVYENDTYISKVVSNEEYEIIQKEKKQRLDETRKKQAEEYEEKRKTAIAEENRLSAARLGAKNSITQKSVDPGLTGFWIGFYGKKYSDGSQIVVKMFDGKITNESPYSKQCKAKNAYPLDSYIQNPGGKYPIPFAVGCWFVIMDSVMFEMHSLNNGEIKMESISQKFIETNDKFTGWSSYK